jgi:thiamine-monophosphate kinase
VSGGGEAARLAAVLRGLGGSARGHDVAIGIGDDAAVLVPPPGQRLVATVDMVLEGQHFHRRGPAAAALRDIGWRALAVNLSDIAAMGALPRFALASLGLPDDMTPADVEALCAGMAALATAHDVAVVGGNLARTSGGLIVDITVLGWAEHPVARAGARAGDRLCVTGRLGAAAAGLALLSREPATHGALGRAADSVLAAQRRPEPRVREGLALGAMARAGLVHAMCDVSDGLALDLSRLCGDALGAVVWRDRLPIPPEVSAVADALSADAGTWALHGGEDYELLCAVDPAALEEVRNAVQRSAGVPLHTIGEFTAGPGQLRLAARPGDDGRPLAAAGWDPFR